MWRLQIAFLHLGGRHAQDMPKETLLSLIFWLVVLCYHYSVVLGAATGADPSLTKTTTATTSTASTATTHQSQLATHAVNMYNNSSIDNPQAGQAAATFTSPKTKVCLVGSGNWGSAIATLVGKNCARLSFCETQVSMWVYEEDVVIDDGTTAKLSAVINQRHENPKYLPGVSLPSNVIAEPDLGTACRDATLLIFVLPHQFLPKLLPIIRQHAAPNCRGVSLIKGLGE